MPLVETVSGPVDSGELGLTLVHEHMRISSESVRAQYPHLYDERVERERAVAEVRRAMEHGVKTIVDPVAMDFGRDVTLARHVVEETGIQLLVGTGLGYFPLPQHFARRDVDYLADAFVHDIEVGIQGSGVKAAFLKCAVDEPGMTEDLDKVLRAIARASLRTGRPIMAHSHPANRSGLDEMAIFEEEGVDPARVQIAHTGDTDDLDYIEELLACGPFIGMDRFGFDITLSHRKRVATVIELCHRGYADRMHLSQDACGTIDWFPPGWVERTVPNWHFTWLFEGVLPDLREGGVTDDQIATMLERNPVRWLTPFVARPASLG
jgi:phosphotriesterase-related protein